MPGPAASVWRKSTHSGGNGGQRRREFAASLGQVVCKPLSPARPPGSSGLAMLYASAVEPRHLAGDGDGIAATMHPFQERIGARYAVRLTIVDEHMFAASIRSSSAKTALDWRTEQDKLTAA